MPSIAKTYDAFISHAASDVAIAAQIAATLRANGVEAITQAEFPPGENASDEVWDALVESRALLLILSSAEPTPSMSVALGAARAWNKPIFGLLTDTTATMAPIGFKDVRLFPSNRIDDVIRAIKLSGEELSDDDRTDLVEAYGELDTSVDQLAMDARALESLVRRFNERTQKALPGEHLLSELLRLRKQGRLTTRDPSRPKRGTA